MSLRSFKEDAKRLRTLRGEECVRAGVGYANTLLLDFRMLHPPNERGYRQPDMSLVAECSWRLETATRVLVGWGDADEDIETRVQVCEGKQVTDVRVFRPSYMARLRFSGDLSIWVFPDRSKFFDPHDEESGSQWYVTGRSFPDG